MQDNSPYAAVWSSVSLGRCIFSSECRSYLQSAQFNEWGNKFVYLLCIKCVCNDSCAAKKLPKTDPAASSANQQQRGVNLRGDEAPPSATGCCNWIHTVAQKKLCSILLLKLGRTLTALNGVSTASARNEFNRCSLWDVPPHLKCVWTLPSGSRNKTDTEKAITVTRCSILFKKSAVSSTTAT